MNFEFISETGKNFNEDICYITDDYGWVLDASTGLADSKYSNFDSDGQWFVFRWNEYLKNNIQRRDKSLSQIVYEGIKIVSLGFDKLTKGKMVSSLAKPSASLGIIRKLDEGYEYLMLGDCSLLVDDGKVKLIKDKTVQYLDEKVVENVKAFMTKGDTFLQAKEKVKDDLIKNRGLKNKEDGYWVLEFDERAVEHAIVGQVSNLNRFAMMSDGFSALFDLYDFCDEKEFLNKIKEYGVKQLYKKIRNIEEDDKKIIKYPRLKKGDDATIIYWYRE